MKKILFLGILLLSVSCTQQLTENAPDDITEQTLLTFSTAESENLAPAADNTALTLSWTKGSAGAAATIEMGVDKTFSGKIYTNTLSAGASSFSFSFRELNDIMMTGLGMEEGVQTSLYVRVAQTHGGATAYSNIVTVTVTPGAVLSPATLTCSSTDLVLYKSSPDKLALSLSWTKNGAGVENAVQFSTENQFLLPYSVTIAKGLHDIQFTAGRLNEILTGSMKMTADEAAPLYIRVVSSYGTSAAYSNTISLNVTPDASGSSFNEKRLFVAGLSSADPWNFNDYLVQYSAINNSYGGVLYADSEYGYKFYPEADNWDYCYTRSSGDAMSGKLMLGNASSANMPQPEAGNLYLFDVSLGGYTYNLTKVTSVSFTGFNDSWSLTEMSQADPTKPVYTATVTVTKQNTYRWQIIINNNWDLKFCASNGYLLLYDEGNAENTIANGKYNLTVDLSTCTYTLTPQ